MRCAACHRSMRKPALVFAGLSLGPVCARKVLVEAGKLAPRQRAQEVVHRDDRTADMFAGVAA